MLALRFVIAFVSAAPLCAQLTLAPVFGRHMVLQREASVPVFGEAAPGATVEVRPRWPGAEVVRGRADGEGRFEVRVRTPAAGGPFELLVASGNVLQRFEDVWIGDVWLCSGQSNMEWPVRKAKDSEIEIAAAEAPTIRLLTVPNAAAPAPERRFEATWQVCSPATVGAFSAVGYAFGSMLSRELDVPIGLIAADVGGTPAEAWTPAAGLRPFEEFAAALTALERTADRAAAAAREARELAAWEREVDAQDLGMTAPGRPVGFAVPCLDDAQWPTVAMPGGFAGTPFVDFDGIVWLRRAVDVPQEWAGRDLVVELGPIDDDDRTFFGGVEIGATRGWREARRYAVPGRLVRGGRTVLAVRVHDTGGEGGFVGEEAAMRLFPKGGDAEGMSLAGEWRAQRGCAEADLPPAPRAGRVDGGTPSALWNGMVAPLVPFTIRGVIWYQGEANVGRAEQYARLFPAMIESWREAWGDAELPFLFVQIAPFAYPRRAPEAAAELRDAQRKTLDVLEHVGMAVTMDVGDPNDIHPLDKRRVGRRLAKWALAKVHGRDVPFSGPLFARVERDGAALRVHFEHAVGLRTTDGAAPSHFEVAGADGVFRPAQAKIDGETVVVIADGVTEPVTVRYAWGAADQPNLANEAGLPASSFRGQVGNGGS